MNLGSRWGVSRRQALTLGAGAASLAFTRPALATPTTMAEALRVFTGGVEVQRGKVKLDIPLLVENGNAVPLKVTVESPMTSDSYVKRVGVFSEKNPLPNIANFSLKPTGAPVMLQTRVRLGDSQNLTVVAELSDGSFWADSKALVVTLPACVETET
jgi:sulfur-oxidizing protein SoxY